jgi:tetratricopeptide (TPR) repeat protein
MDEGPRPAPTEMESAPAADATPDAQLLTTGGSLARSPHECLDPGWLAGFLAGGRPALPGYELLEEIGRGGMGVVYRARDLTFGRDVAVKLTHPGHGSVSAAAGRFRGEARITGRLQHPGIPPAYQAGTLADGRPYLVMKLVAGRTLEALRAEEPSALNVLAVCEAVCQAVGYAHARGVIHRDLKPSNVMVGAFGEVQVMDWGLAKENGPSEAVARSEGSDTPGDSESPVTRPGGVVGTPAYLPPEQAAGAAVDPRADVFALGGILCFLLTGRPPYAGTSVEAVRQAAAGQTEEALARLDASGAEPGLVALAKRCLAADPAARPADGRAVAAEVAALRAAAEKRARQAELERAQAEVRAAEQRMRRRVQLALAGSVAALLIAAGVGLWWADRQAAERRVAAARNREALAVALDQAEAGLRRQNPAYGEVDAALAQAEHRLKNEGVMDEDRGRYEELARARRLLDRLDEIDRRRWMGVGADELQFDAGHAKEQYPLALREYGLDAASRPADDLARQVRQSPVSARIVAALDAWLGVGAHDALDLINALDPDPDRVALRLAYDRKDEAAIRRLAPAADNPATPASFAVLLGTQRLTPTADALRILKAAQLRSPGDFGLAMTTGVELSKRGREGDAVKYFQIAVAIRPGSAVAWYNLGTVFLQQNHQIEAVVSLREAVRLDPDSTHYFFNLGNALFQSGDLAGAAAAYRDGVRAGPKHVGCRGNLGSTLFDLKDYPGAAAAFRAAIPLAPGEAMLHHNLGNALFEQGDFAGAASAYREAVRLRPDSAEYRCSLGQVLYNQNDMPGGVREFRAAVRLDPNHAVAYCALGAGLQSQQQAEDAIEAYRKAASLNVNVAPNYENLAKLLAGQGRYAAALRALHEGGRVNSAWWKDPATNFRYDAARYGVLAGSGKGKDAPAREEWAALRREALDSLRADLESWWREHGRGGAARGAASQNMQRWLSCEDFDPVRAPAALAALPAEERRAWEQFWAGVRCLRDATDPRRELLPPPRGPGLSW